MTVAISTSNGRLVLKAPYHPQLPAKAKALGGKWDATTKTWTFDTRDEGRVRELARAIYGSDGSDVSEMVTVRVDLDQQTYGDTLWLFGREIAHRQGRDASVRLGDGVILITGGFYSSGGSARYPDLKPRDGTVLEVRDVPKAMVTDAKGVEIVEEKIDATALQAERERLIARLAEIDTLLGDKVLV